MDEAFGICLNAPATCLTYHQLMGELQRERPNGFQPSIHITIEGRTPGPDTSHAPARDKRRVAV